MEKNGKSFYDMSNDDYLQDFDVFQQVFDKKSDLFGGDANDKGASDIMGPMALRKPGDKAFEGVVPHPTTTEALSRNSDRNGGAGSYAISKQKMQENTVNNLDVTLGLNTSSKSLAREETAMGLSKESVASDKSINGEQVASRTADVSGGGLEANGPPVQPGTQGGALAATGGNNSKGKEELESDNPAALEPLDDEMIPVTPIPQNASKSEENLDTSRRARNDKGQFVNATVLVDDQTPVRKLRESSPMPNRNSSASSSASHVTESSGEYNDSAQQDADDQGRLVGGLTAAANIRRRTDTPPIARMDTPADVSRSLNDSGALDSLDKLEIEGINIRRALDAQFQDEVHAALDDVEELATAYVKHEKLMLELNAELAKGKAKLLEAREAR